MMLYKQEFASRKIASISLILQGSILCSFFIQLTLMTELHNNFRSSRLHGQNWQRGKASRLLTVAEISLI